MLKRIFAILLDLLILLGLVLILFILLTGGGTYTIGTKRIIAYSYSSGLYGLLLILLFRIFLAKEKGFLGVDSLSPREIYQMLTRAAKRLEQWLTSMNLDSAIRCVTVIILISFLIKLANAWYYYGFLIGDDVEIQEMTFSKLFHWDWQASPVRNPFYPLCFIYPFQALLHFSGVDNPRILIFSGRMIVALFSCLNLWMIFKIAHLEFSSISIAILASFFLAVNKLHEGYGSTELPRTVSSFFLLLSVWCAIKKEKPVLLAIVSGLVLGISAAMRFSEVFYALPLLILFRLKKRISQTVLCGFVFCVTTLFILGLTDYLYWGKAFYSIHNVIDFSLIKRQSSHGYQPFYEYLALMPVWTNVAFVLLLLLGSRYIPWRFMNFVWIPLLLLSILPQKEARYALPAIPFLSICLAVSFWNLISARHESHSIISFLRTPALILFLLFAGILFEMDGFRMRRSESAVDMARFINEQGTSAVAIEQIWKTGGRLYMNRIERLEDISPRRITDQNYVTGIIQDPAIEFVAFQSRDLRRSDYRKIIERNGFRLISYPFNSDRKEYELFQRLKLERK
jgi:hypothetical protein